MNKKSTLLGLSVALSTAASISAALACTTTEISCNGIATQPNSSGPGATCYMACDENGNACGTFVSTTTYYGCYNDTNVMDWAHSYNSSWYSSSGCDGYTQQSVYPAQRCGTGCTAGCVGG